jgi:hypothetical protein
MQGAREGELFTSLISSKTSIAWNLRKWAFNLGGATFRKIRTLRKSLKNQIKAISDHS